MKTRSSESIFNRLLDVKPMSIYKLPMAIDISRHYIYQTTLGKSKKEAIVVTLDMVEDIWHAASVPTITRAALNMKFTRILTHLTALRKNSKTKTFQQQILNYIDQNSRLYDICSCQCMVFKNSKCLKNKRVTSDRCLHKCFLYVRERHNNSRQHGTCVL